MGATSHSADSPGATHPEGRGRPVLCVVGTGQLGSRHLQALASLPYAARVFGVDPSDAARALAAERFAQISGHERHTMALLPSLAGLPDEIDVAIVATSARERLKTVLDLLRGRCVRFLVLEKVLCQSAGQCQDLLAVVRKHGVRTWVNAPRRLWPGFRLLRERMAGARLLGFSAVGGGWGIACNTYHLLDLLAWLSGAATNVQISGEFLDPTPVPSKRPGFLELTGSLVGRAGTGVSFLISDAMGIARPLEMTLVTERETFWIDNSSGRLCVLSCPNATVAEIGSIRGPLQSELTALVASDLLTSGECGLTPLEEAVGLHVPMLAAFATVFDRQSGGGGVCPIT